MNEIFSDISSAISWLHFAIFVSTALHVEIAYLSTVDLQPEIRKHIEIAHKNILAEFRKVIFYPANFLLSAKVFLIML